MTHLACFFKDPLGIAEQSFVEQFRLLTDYIARHTKDGPQATRVRDLWHGRAPRRVR